ncbi:MAG TPA: anaerobic ribonucleoside-triphosphate reductase activating protein [Candidatus Goldiibacteriota bacterium]|mgnify:CR=1 FL=1|nr:anaerobic ribonucleoside-triphosphate reductase activating protein [Candidatus Goldiibacteriota bacterium]
MRINGFIGVSLIEFPNKISSVIYTSPCNFRCPFCHNPALISINATIIDENDVLDDLKERVSFIDGVSITGGEPLLQNDLPDFLRKIKNSGLLVKIDTNGYLTEKIRMLIDGGLVDYVAMDVKTSIKKYEAAAGFKIDVSKIINSIKLIMNSGVDYEFRTTVVPGIVNGDDFEEIGELIKGAKLFSIQQFENSFTLDGNFRTVQPYTEKILHEFSDTMKKYVEKVKIKNTNIYA